MAIVVCSLVTLVSVQYITKDSFNSSKFFINLDLVPEDDVIEVVDADENVDRSTSEVISHVLGQLRRVGIFW